MLHFHKWTTYKKSKVTVSHSSGFCQSWENDGVLLFQRCARCGKERVLLKTWYKTSEIDMDLLDDLME